MSDEQDEQSPEEQLTENEEAAADNGWRIAGRYSDQLSASSYARKARPEWGRFVERVKAGAFDVAVLWEPSRGGRELENWAGFLNACRRVGCLIYVTSHDRLYDMANARDRRSLQEDGIDSEHESEKISKRSRRGVAKAVARGEPYGRIPYGYRRWYTSERGRPKPVPHQGPDPDTAPVVVEIVSRVAAGDAISAIARDLTARGVPTPTGGARWAHSTIVRIVLQGVVYISKRRHNGSGLIDGNWPALVDEPTYWRAVAVLNDPARKKAAGQRGGIRPGNAKWLLSYIAWCAKCGGPLSVQLRPRGGEMVPCYRCSSSAGGCAVAPVKRVDEIVTDDLIDFCANCPGVFEGIMFTDDRERQRYLDEAEAERARLAKFEADAIAGRISSDSFARVAAGIEPNIADLEARARASAPPALQELLAHGNRADTLRAVWKGMPLASQRRVITALLAAEPGCYLRLRPSGVRGRAHGDAALDPARIELRLPLGWQAAHTRG